MGCRQNRALENIWLFERRKDGKIITKLSDGQHCYGELPAYYLSAWQAAQMGGYEGTEEEFYETLGTLEDVVDQVTGIATSLSGKYAETPTLESTPTEDTLTYTPEDSEEPRPFSIGQQCRVYEEDEADWVFYQLYDITENNKADWRVAGSGGASAFQEKAIITPVQQPGRGRHRPDRQESDRQLCRPVSGTGVERRSPGSEAAHVRRIRGDPPKPQTGIPRPKRRPTRQSVATSAKSIWCIPARK